MERYKPKVREGRLPLLPSMTISLSLTMVCGVLTSCDPVGPGFFRFGTDGLVRVTIEVPLQGGIGRLQQVLTWNSEGAWTLFEEIGYDGAVGDRTLIRNPGLPYTYAANYLSLLHLVNDNRGTKLWGLADWVADCSIARSRVRFLIHDNMLDEQKEWVRCAATATPLRGLSTEGVAPGESAERVIQVSMRARDFTLGEDSDRYAYTGSLPFATLERGTETGMDLEQPRLFRSTVEGKESEAPRDWLDFWEEHTKGSGRKAPEIDWANEMVVVATLGVRHEIGDSIEVRRVLLVGDEDERRVKFEVVRRVPGNYCTPVSRTIWPYHMAVTPRKTVPDSYGRKEERVPCEV